MIKTSDKYRLIILTFISLCYTSSCSVQRFLEKDELLYDKVEIELESEIELPDTKKMEEDLYWLTRPKPNKKWFGFMRANLWAFFKAEKRGSESNNYLTIKGENPVYLDTTLVETNCRRMEAFLFNNGYYGSTVNFETSTKGQFARILYKATIEQAYELDSIFLPISNNPKIDHLIQAMNFRSFL